MGFRKNGTRWTWDEESTAPYPNWYEQVTTTYTTGDPVEIKAPERKIGDEVVINSPITTPGSDWYEPVTTAKDTIKESELEETIKKIKKEGKLEVIEAVPKVMPTYNYGWICPKCGRANAPWVSSCACVASKWEITC